MSQRELILWQLQNRDLHDPDFRYFSRLAGSNGLFIDAGANRGQSIVSMRLVWPECRIVAFEPTLNPQIRDALSHISLLMGGVLNYFSALGERETEGVFATPIVDGQEILEQGTLAPEQMERPFILDGLRKIGKEISLSEVIVPIRPLDFYDLAPTVIKIDTEGYERKVLEGAARTIKKHKPLLLIENNDWGSVTDYLAEFGYACFRYLHEEDRLTPFYGQTANAFYLSAPFSMLP